MFAYCNNNPAIYYDYNGELLLLALGVLVVGGAIVGGTVGGITAHQSGGNVWMGILEGVIIGGGATAIGAFTPGGAIAFGLFMDLAFQCGEAVYGDRTEFDAIRWIKAGMGAACSSIPSEAWGIDFDSIITFWDAFGALLVMKQPSILFGICDISTTYLQQRNDSTSQAQTIDSNTMPIYSTCPAGSVWIATCQ